MVSTGARPDRYAETDTSPTLGIAHRAWTQATPSGQMCQRGGGDSAVVAPNRGRSAVDVLQQLMSAAAGTDLSGDGAPEIVSLYYTGSSVKLGEPDPKRRLVLVLVEARLLQTPGSDHRSRGDPRCCPDWTGWSPTFARRATTADWCRPTCTKVRCRRTAACCSRCADSCNRPGTGSG